MEKMNLRAVGKGVIQRALPPVAVDAEASRAVAAPGSSSTSCGSPVGQAPSASL